MNENLKNAIEDFAFRRVEEIGVEVREQNKNYVQTSKNIERLTELFNDRLPFDLRPLFIEYAEERTHELSIIEGLMYLQGFIDGISVCSNSKERI